MERGAVHRGMGKVTCTRPELKTKILKELRLSKEGCSAAVGCRYHAACRACRLSRSLLHLQLMLLKRALEGSVRHTP